MDTLPAVKHELPDNVAVTGVDVRLARANKRVAAAEARIADLQREHDDACAQEVVRLNRETTKVHSRTEHMLRDIQARERGIHEQREVVEAQTCKLIAEAEAIRVKNDEMRSKVDQEVATIDERVEEALRCSNTELDCLSASVEGEVHGIMGTLSYENTRVWALENHESFARELTGAKALDYAPDPVPDRDPLPFGSPHMPFDGYGTYGSKPPQKHPRGFKEDTTRRLLNMRC